MPGVDPKKAVETAEMEASATVPPGMAQVMVVPANQVHQAAASALGDDTAFEIVLIEFVRIENVTGSDDEKVGLVEAAPIVKVCEGMGFTAIIQEGRLAFVAGVQRSSGAKQVWGRTALTTDNKYVLHVAVRRPESMIGTKREQLCVQNAAQPNPRRSESCHVRW